MWFCLMKPVSGTIFARSRLVYCFIEWYAFTMELKMCIFFNMHFACTSVCPATNAPFLYGTSGCPVTFESPRKLV